MARSGKQDEVRPEPSIRSAYWIQSGGRKQRLLLAQAGSGGRDSVHSVMALHSSWCLSSLVDKMEEWLACPWTKWSNWGFRTTHKGPGQQTFATRNSDHTQQTLALCLADSTVELFSRANGMKCPLGIPTSVLYLIDTEIWPQVCGDKESDKLSIAIWGGWGQHDRFW